MSASNPATLNTPESRLRVLSAAVLAPVVLFVVYLGGASFAGLIGLVMSAGLYEWLRLVDPDVPAIDRYAFFVALIVIVLFAAIGYPVFGFIVLALASVAFYAHRSNIDAERAFFFALGLPYMAGSGIALITLRGTPMIGLSLTAYLLAVVWGMDTGGYVFGRLIGGPKLAPMISPNKTWSGFAGGVGLAALLATIVLVATGARHIFSGVIVAVILAAVSQGGDLFKSFFKRRAGVKDCGNLIPGHGGVLDRIDGLVFAAMVLALLQALFGYSMIW